MSWLECLWPQRTVCLLCGGLSRGEHLCDSCRQALDTQRLEERYAVQADGKIRSVWRHEGEARRLVHELKYEAVASAGEQLLDGMAEAASRMNLPPDTVITWVPMPGKRKLERGVDHGCYLASGLGDRLGLSAEALLRRRDDCFGTPQEGLNRLQRWRNLQNAFASVKEIHHPVLLVDDVFTTGATALTCMKCLQEAGAVDIWVVTATRALAHKPGLKDNNKEERS